MADLMKMAGFAIATVTLAVVTLVGIAIVEGFKGITLSETFVGNGTVNQTIKVFAVDNATADLFIAGLTIFGTFMAIISLALVGKIIIGIVRAE